MNFGVQKAVGSTERHTPRPDAAVFGALEDRLHDAVGAVAVFERRDGRRQRRDTGGPAAMLP